MTSVHWAPFGAGVLAAATDRGHVIIWDLDQWDPSTQPNDDEQQELMFVHGGHFGARVSSFRWCPDVPWLVASVSCPPHTLLSAAGTSGAGELHFWKPCAALCPNAACPRGAAAPLPTELRRSASTNASSTASSGSGVGGCVQRHFSHCLTGSVLDAETIEKTSRPRMTVSSTAVEECLFSDVPHQPHHELADRACRAQRQDKIVEEHPKDGGFGSDQQQAQQHKQQQQHPQQQDQEQTHEHQEMHLWRKLHNEQDDRRHP